MRTTKKGTDVIVTFASKNYAHWLDLLLKSYRKSNPGKKAKIYLIMTEDDFKEYKSDKDFEYHWIPAHESLDMTENSEGRIRSILRLKTTLILIELLLHTDRFLWVDADSIITKDITPLLDKIGEYDFLCTSRPWKEGDYCKLAAAVLGVANKPHMIKFMAQSTLDVWSHWEGWWSEQLHLYRNLNDKIKHYALTPLEHSIKNKHDAIIIAHHANEYEDMVDIYEKM